VPVEFLADDEAAVFGKYPGAPSRAELERAFFLDDADKELIAKCRGAHNRLGFALQLTTVRWLGTFLGDPLDVPAEVLAYVAEQLSVANPSCVSRYMQRRTTRFEHAELIVKARGLVNFAEAEKELEAYLRARAWATGDGPRVIFDDAVRWLGGRGVLLPGVTTLARLVARVRDEAAGRLWETLNDLLDGGQRLALDQLLEVPDGARYSKLDRWRTGPAKSSGKNLERALARAAEVQALGFRASDLAAVVPPRRLAEMGRYGLAAKAPQLRRHPAARRSATLLATVVHLQAKAIDDCLELFDLLMVTELLGKAERQSDSEKLRQHPRLAQASAMLAAAVAVLMEAASTGSELRAGELWEAIDAVVPRAELRAALATIGDLVPALGAADDDKDVRAALVTRIVTVSGFVKTLTEVISFGANAEASRSWRP
jgi:hypothetical protein